MRIRVRGKASIGLRGRRGGTGAGIWRRRQFCAYYGLLAVLRYANQCRDLYEDLDFFRFRAPNDGG